MNCVNCAFPLPMPPADHCMRCGAPVSASFAPAGATYPSQFAAFTPDQQEYVAGTVPLGDSAAAAAHRPRAQGQSVVISPAPTMPLAPPASTVETLNPPPATTSRRSMGWIIALVVVALIVGEVIGAGLYAFTQHSWPFAALATHASATSARTATPNPSSYHFQDSLQTNANGWLEVPSNCYFGQGGYYVNNGSACPAPAQSITDGSVSVDVTLVQAVHGDAVAGLWFRVSSDQSVNQNTYEVVIGRDGQWSVEKALDGTTTDLMGPTDSPAIHQGLNVANTLKVQMTGPHFVFFVNGTQIGAVDDASLTQGGFALVAIPGAEAVFSNFDVQSATS